MKFKVKPEGNGFRFVLAANNGAVVMTSTKVYDVKVNAFRAIDSIKERAKTTIIPVIDETVFQPNNAPSPQLNKHAVSGRSEQLPWWEEQIKQLEEAQRVAEKRIQELGGNCH